MAKPLFQYENWGVSVLPANINMALEEFLLKRVAGSKDKKAALRFYSFSKDSIVLGYAQDTDVIKKLDNDVYLTRRITGGSHVQTGRNTLAYSFVVPKDGNFYHFEEMRAYYASLIAKALKSLGLGPIEVDNKASTINVGPRIIASHAMFWGVKSALLHGIIILIPYDVDKIAQRVVLSERDIGGKTYSEYWALKKLPVVSEELPERKRPLILKPEFLRELVSRAITKEVAGEKFRRMKVNNNVIKEATHLMERRYGAPVWIKEHEPTFTTSEAEVIPGEDLTGPLRKGLGYCLFSQVSDEKFKEMV